MTRFLGLLAVITVALMAVAAGRNAPSVHAQTSPSVLVTPASGSQNDTFVFDGAGFAANEILTETYTDPSGQQYAFYAADGATTLIQADGNGSWEVTVHPIADFAGGYAGTWLASFCSQSTGACFSGAFDISS